MAGGGERNERNCHPETDERREGGCPGAAAHARRVTTAVPGHSYTGAMAGRARGRVVASLLSLLLPGAGQLYLGARRRGLVLLGVTAALLVGAVALAAVWPTGVVDRRLVAVLLAVDLALLGGAPLRGRRRVARRRASASPRSRRSPLPRTLPRVM